MNNSPGPAPRLQDAGLELFDGYTLLTLQRDDIRNALTGSALVDDICAAINWCNSQAEIRALVITGAGRAFSAGGNIHDMRDRQAEIVTIAAVNGAAVGAGLDLCCMCDLRIGCDDSRFGETFVNLGIIPGDGGAWFLQRLVGYQRAAELTFSGRIVDADEALRIGLLLEKTRPETLLERALAYAADYARKPPFALRQSKRLMREAQQMPLPPFLDLCAEVQAQCHHTEDHHRAVAAFFDKSTPRFSGK